MAFSAPESLLGYLNQLRYALVHILKQEDATIALECRDDIEIVEQGGHARLIQLKQHGAGAVLSDASPDLWKTLRIWIGAVKSGTDPGVTSFVLVTTSTAAGDSAAALLRAGADRNPAKALAQLEETAKKSDNKQLKTSFEAFRGLPQATKQALFASIYVLDQGPAIAESRALLERALSLSVDRVHRSALADRLEGWWFEQCIQQLLARRGPIASAEAASKVVDLARGFSPSGLPIDYFGAHPDDESLWDNLFVDQLKEVELGLGRIEKAVLDYFRAFVQRSRWARDQLLVDAELEGYDDHLIDEWDRQRLLLLDEQGTEATESELRRTGRKLVAWMERDADLRIRPDVVQPYVMRGSFHMLADHRPPRVWWHPSFLEKLARREVESEQVG